MYKYRTGGLVPMIADLETQARQVNTDVDRLWRLQNQQGLGGFIGNDPSAGYYGPPGGGGGGTAGKIYEGETLSTLSRPINGWLSPTTGTVQEYDEDPANPGKYIAIGSAITITNRDTNLAIAAGVYVQWEEVTTQNGNTEYRITWVSR